MTPDQPDPADVYRARIEQAKQAIEPLRRRFDRIAHARLAVVVGIVGSLVAGAYLAKGPGGTLVALVALVACTAAFVALLAAHARVSEETERAKGLQRVNAHALARRARDWGKTPLPTAPRAARESTLAGDLDLFGTGSLFHLLGTVGTPQGRHTLAGWLTSPGGDGRARQEAVRELARELDWRQDLELAAAPLAGVSADADPFVAWAASEPLLQGRPGLVWASRVLPVGIVAALALFFTGSIGPGWAVGLLVVRWLLVRRYGAAVELRLDLVGGKERRLRGYGGLFRLTDGWSPAGAWLRERRDRLAGAAAAMDRLETLTGLAAIRDTPASPLAQWLFLWDFHALFLTERWQAQHGALVRGWFEALGEVEAAAALAALAFDEPGWTFPEFGAEPKIVGRQLGHPLLPAGSRVANDVTLGPPGTFLLVTGSNMSGKSTLLRTVGINVVLAQAGGVVCAEEMRLPGRLTLATSLRVQDSLQDGVSFFMAELQRLASVVERADALEAGGEGTTLLYLLDEILRGTNTQERQVIVGKVVAHLLRRRAIGAVTTHDLSLAEVEGLTDACRAVHFTEEFEEGADGKAVMRFDYRMRPGLATTTNALKLLRVIGLKL